MKRLMKVRVPKALRSPALEPEAAFNTVFPPLWLPRWLSGKESACQCRRRGPDSRVGNSPWRRKWQPTPAFLPGKSRGQRSPAGYSPWGREESDTTERLNWTKLRPATSAPLPFSLLSAPNPSHRSLPPNLPSHQMRLRTPQWTLVTGGFWALQMCLVQPRNWVIMFFNQFTCKLKNWYSIQWLENITVRLKQLEYVGLLFQLQISWNLNTDYFLTKI